jgi:hypothetical protein
MPEGALRRVEAQKTMCLSRYMDNGSAPGPCSSLSGDSVHNARGFMRFGIRRPSFRKRIAARTSWRRVVRHNLGVKAPRGYGWLTNPRKAAYNRVYNRTTVGLGRGCLVAVLAGVAALAGAGLIIAFAVRFR